MDKLPTNLFVGIVAGVTGAGIMWLCLDGGKERAMVGNGADAERARAVPASRIGMPENYRLDAAFEKVRSGAERVDPKVLGRLAGQASGGNAGGARRGPEERRASDFASLRGGAADGATHPAFWPTAYIGAPGAVADPLPARGGMPAFITRKASDGGVDDALTVALEAATPYVRGGFTVREEYWGGVMGDSPRAITHQLFKGNEYWFWAGTDIANSGIEVHVYDSDGNLAESEHWKLKGVAAAGVNPGRTGTYYLIISDERTSAAQRPRTVHWAMAYGFR
jgi:hypothetical protein